MAHFRAVIQGARGEASRLGHENSGISTLLQTWGWDVRVTCEHQNEQDSALVELVNHTTGQRIPLLDLNLSAEDYNDVVAFIYRTVDDKAWMGKAKQPKTGQLCSCRPGIERENCSKCEGTGMCIDFAAIRNARKPQ